MNKSYVYRHIRLDKNEVFYIGMGTEVRNRSKQRAYCRERKNRHWMNIAKSIPYDVEIIVDGLTVDQAMRKEREFISLYGRRDMGKGTLVNLTDGGDYSLGKKHSDLQKELSSIRKSKKVCQYDLNGRFIKLYPSAEKAAIDTRGSKSHICKCANLKKNNFTAKGFIWRWYSGSIEDIEINIKYDNDRKKVKIDKFDLKGNFMSYYECLLDASIDTGIPKTQICAVLKGRKSRTKEFTWRYHL